MKKIAKLSLGVVFLIAAGAASGGEAPFSPLSGVPDYVATMQLERRWESAAGPTERVIRHHRGWVKIEDADATTFGSFSDDVEIVVGKHPEAEYAYFLLNREIPGSAFEFRNATETRETETHAGESCTVWEAMRGRVETSSLRYFSCVTPDGIEIASRVVGSDGTAIRSTMLVSLERLPVASEQVSPPQSLLKFSEWIKFDDSRYVDRGTGRPDFNITLEATKSVRQLRHHYPWSYEDTKQPDGSRSVSIWNEETGQQISFSARKGEFQRLYARRAYLEGERLIFPMGVRSDRKALDKKGVVRDEECEWFNMAPGMADAHLHHCLTSDGIPLRIRTGGWGRFDEYIATSVERRNVTLPEMLPPNEIASRANWDIPEAFE